MANRPTSGQLSLSQVRADLGGSGQINMDASDVRALTVKPAVYPTGSEIKMSDLYFVAAAVTITPSVTSVSEGDTVVFNITATSTVDGTIFYWTNVGTTSGGDFSNTSGFNTGSVTINSGAGSFSLVLTNDFFVESAETIIIQLHTGSTAGPVIATSATVTVAGTGVTYSVVPDSTDINEGDTVTFDIVTENIANNATLYWTISGTIDGADFTDGAMNGSVVINVPGYPASTTGYASVTRTLVNDLSTDGDETIVFELRAVSVADPIVATATPVTVRDTSQSAVTPTYAIAPNVTSVNEGGTVTYTITTTNVTPGTMLYWNNAGTSVASDFTDDVDQGSVTLSGTLASGTATFTRTLKNDSLTEGSETIEMVIRTGGQAGVPGSVLRATAATVTINDTSIGVVAPTYAIVGSPDPANEGSTVTFTITTTNVTDGTVLDWTNIGNSQSADFVGGAMSGTVTINSNSGTITRQLVNDLTTEGASETIQIQLSNAGSVVATSNIIEINDTSVTPAAPTYALAPTLTTITEGQTVTFNVTTTNVSNGTTLYWTRNTTVATPRVAATDLAAVQGTVTINSNAGSFTVTPILDNIESESTENLVIDLRTTGYSGTIVASSTPIVQVLNSTFTMTPSSTSVVEGQSLTVTVNTTNVPNSTTLYWTSTGSSADISPTQGTVTINSNTGQFIIAILTDSLTETESFDIQLRLPDGLGGYTGAIVETITIAIADPTLSETRTITVGYKVLDSGSVSVPDRQIWGYLPGSPNTGSIDQSYLNGGGGGAIFGIYYDDEVGIAVPRYFTLYMSGVTTDFFESVTVSGEGTLLRTSATLTPVYDFFGNIFAYTWAWDVGKPASWTVGSTQTITFNF